MKFETCKSIYSTSVNKLTGIEKALLIYLCYRTNAEGNAFPSLKRISRDISYCLTTVKGTIKSLIEKNFIRKIPAVPQSSRRSNVYQLNHSMLFAQKPVDNSVDKYRKSVDKFVDKLLVNSRVDKHTGREATTEYINNINTNPYNNIIVNRGGTAYQKQQLKEKEKRQLAYLLALCKQRSVSQKAVPVVIPETIPPLTPRAPKTLAAILGEKNVTYGQLR